MSGDFLNEDILDFEGDEFDFRAFGDVEQGEEILDLIDLFIGADDEDAVGSVIHVQEGSVFAGHQGLT